MPLLILTLVKVNFDNGRPNDWARHDLGLAVGNLTAQATSMDLYVHNMAGFDKEAAIKLFNLPQEYQPVTDDSDGFSLGDRTFCRRPSSSGGRGAGKKTAERSLF